MTVYRSAPVTTPVSLRVACAHCGVLAEVRRSDDTFRCHKCDQEQPTRRETMPREVTSLRAVSHTTGTYTELVAFARSVGVDAQALMVRVACDGIPCDVSIGINSGSVDGVYLTAATQGLPTVTLRHETLTEKHATREGITHEAQTGDKAFDDAVFVASDDADEDVLAALSVPAVRAAIRQLLTESDRVSLAPHGVSVHIRWDVNGVFDPDRIRARLNAVRVIAGAPRSMAPRAATADVWGVGAAIAVVGGVILGPIITGAAWTAFQPVSSRLGHLAVAVGLTLALLLQPLLKRKLRGRSDSHTSLLLGRAASVIVLTELCISLAVFVNAAFDHSTASSHDLVIVSVSHDDEDHESKVVARGDAGLEEQELQFNDRERLVAPGQHVILRVKRGALGFPWRSAPGEAHAGKQILIEK
ncbi:Hypothetical protein A7982_03302 [Minicystis rosea]|nr:Hypothetical protein A7982_03302 [Minicystis rosea]